MRERTGDDEPHLVAEGREAGKQREGSPGKGDVAEEGHLLRLPFRRVLDAPVGVEEEPGREDEGAEHERAISGQMPTETEAAPAASQSPDGHPAT